MDADPSSEVAALLESPSHIPNSRSLSSRLSPTTWNTGGGGGGGGGLASPNSGGDKEQKDPRSRQNSTKSSGSGWFSWARSTSKSSNKLNVPTVVFNADDDDTATDALENPGDNPNLHDNPNKEEDLEAQLRGLGSRPTSRCNSRLSRHYSAERDHSSSSPQQLQHGDPHGDILYQPVPGTEQSRHGGGDSTSSSSRKKSWAKEALSTIYALNPPPRTISQDMNEFGGSKNALNSNHLGSCGGGSNLHGRLPRSCSNTVSTPSFDQRHGNSTRKQPWGTGGSLNLDDIGGLSQVVMEAIPRSDGQVSRI